MVSEIKNQERQIAIKCRIKDIIKGTYKKEEGSLPNYVLSKDNRKISRINIVGVIVSIPSESDNSLMLDDGSGKINVRNFDDKKVFNNVNMGDVVILIGRPREYNNEKYLVLEIIKKVENKLWIDIRKKELQIYDLKNEKKNIDIDKSVIEEIDYGNKDEPSIIYELIKRLDKGDGASFQEVNSISKMKNSESIISSLLLSGDIFEIRAGKLKVLE